MTEQAIMLGIPSFQLEIPHSVRRRLLIDDSLRSKFHYFFNSLFEIVIVPDCKKKNRQYNISEEIAKMFSIENEIKDEKHLEEVYEQIKKF